MGRGRFGGWHGVVFAVVPVVCLAAGLGRSAAGQALPTAKKSAAVIIFGGISRVSPEYGPNTNYGAMFGADFTRYTRWADPSVEIRYTDSSGSTVGESTLEGGFKIEKEFGRLRPYGDFLFGYGSIVFQHPVIYPTGPYSSDNSFVYGGGGGVDYKIKPNFALKLDVQTQSWKLGTEAASFSPVAVSVGISVNVPFLGLPGRR